MRTLRTVTLNTGYDDYYTVGEPVWGGVSPMHEFRRLCSGKGISCARTAKALGVPTVAYALIGIDDEADYSMRLAAEGIEHRLVSVPGTTRHNLTLVDASGDKVAAHFVAQGFHLGGPDDVAPLVEALLADLQPGDIVTLNGSVPTGLPDETWAHLASTVLDRGAEVIVDAQKAALVAALEVPGVLAFKPNDDEILAIPRVAAADPEDRVVVALEILQRAGARLPMVSLGAHGVAVAPEVLRNAGAPMESLGARGVAVAPEVLRSGGARLPLVSPVARGVAAAPPPSPHHPPATPDGAVAIAQLPVEQPVQSVMAGDAFVAGLAWGYLASPDPAEWLRHGLGAAAAHVEGLTGDALGERARQNLRAARLA